MLRNGVYSTASTDADSREAPNNPPLISLHFLSFNRVTHILLESDCSLDTATRSYLVGVNPVTALAHLSEIGFSIAGCSLEIFALCLSTSHPVLQTKTHCRANSF